MLCVAILSLQKWTFVCLLTSLHLHFHTQGQAEWQGILGTIAALTTLRDLKLSLPYEESPNPELEQAIATTWPQQLTNLAALDLPSSRLGPAATTAIMYDMPSLTSLKCDALSAPTRQQLVTQLKDIRVKRTDLPTLASLRLGPQCNLDMPALGLSHSFLMEGPEGEGRVAGGLQQLAAAADTLGHCKSVSLCGEQEIGGPLEAEASERMMRALTAGLRGGSNKLETMEFTNFTFQQGSSAALVELLQATPLVDNLVFR